MPRSYEERVSFYAEVENIDYHEAELLLAAGATFHGDDFLDEQDAALAASLFDDGWDGWGPEVVE